MYNCPIVHIFTVMGLRINVWESLIDVQNKDFQWMILEFMQYVYFPKQIEIRK